MGYRLCMGKSILCIDLKNQPNKRICKYQLTQEIHLNQEEHPFRVVEITLIALNPSRRGEGSAALCVSISSTPHSCRSMKPSPLVGTILYSKCQSNLSTQDLPAEKKTKLQVSLCGWSYHSIGEIWKKSVLRSWILKDFGIKLFF